CLGFEMKRVLAIVIATLIAPSIRAQSPTPTYWQDIRPVFRKHCTVCHSAKNLGELDVSGGLALDTLSAVLKGTQQQVVHPGQSAESRLVKLITSDNPKRRMPLDAPPLPKETIDLIRRWIDGGAREGQQPDAAAETLPTVKTATTRKLDILLPT